MLRHERLAVAMALAEEHHHSACRTVPEEKEEVEHYEPCPNRRWTEQGGENKTSWLEVSLLGVGLSSILCRRGSAAPILSVPPRSSRRAANGRL